MGRPALEEALARTETIINAFKMTGLYPFDPLAVNRNKLLPGDQYQLPASVDLEVVPVLPEDAVVLQAAPLSPKPGPSRAPDMTDDNGNAKAGQAHGAAESFSCISCAQDKMVFESVHHCNRVCQQCVLELAESAVTQGFSSIFCPCGDQFSLEALKPFIPADLHLQLSAPSTPRGSSRVSATAPVQLKTVGEMTREEKKRQLNKFEIVMLLPQQQLEFEEIFEAGVRYECSSSLYLSWLSLKLDSLETEKEVLDRFFVDKMPANLPKKVTARRVRKPDGSARFDPLSKEWKEIWEEQENEKNEKEEKKKETDRRREEKQREKESLAAAKKAQLEAKTKQKMEREATKKVREQKRPEEVNKEKKRGKRKEPEGSLENVFKRKR